MFNNLTIKLRLTLLSGLLCTLLFVTSSLGLFGINQSNDSIEILYTNRLASIEALSDVSNNLFKERVIFNAALSFQNEIPKYLEQLTQLEANIDKQWEIYAELPATPEEEKLIEQFKMLRGGFQHDILKPEIELLKEFSANPETGNAKLKAHAIDKIRPMYVKLLEIHERLLEIQHEEGARLYSESKFHFKIVFSVLGGLVLIGLIMSIVFSNAVITSILKSLSTVQKIAEQIANGNLDSKIDTNVKDETAAMLKAMQTMQSNLDALMDEIENTIKAGLKGDFSIKSDTSNKKGFFKDILDTLNKLTTETNTSLQDVIRVTSALSNGELSQKITKDYKGSFGLTARGVNETVDSIAKTINEIQVMIDASANRGDFSYRMNLSDKKGYTKILAELLNQLSTLTDSGLNDMLRVVDALAEGDLTQSVSKDYPGIFGKLKTSVNETTEKLQGLMGEIRETSHVIASAAKEIASGNNDLSHRTEQQAASLEETASSMQELTSTVQHNSENAKQANELAVGASETANRGVTVVNQVVSTMENINQSSLRIVDIISVIDDIAFQTNILALNAAVEAARAGDQGKGFAVVATEVRNLAQRAANAAGEIKRLIGDSVERVTGGSKQVAEAGKTMQDIVDSITKVTTIIAEIASASAEQNAGIAQVGQAISSIDDVTQQNAALVEEVAAAAEALEAQTGHLTSEMAHFKTNRNSNSNASSVKSMIKSTPAAKSLPVTSTKKVESKASFTAGADDWEEF